MINVAYMHRVEPYKWLFVQDFGPYIRGRKFHLRYVPAMRIFTAFERSGGLGGWSNATVLPDRDAQFLRSLLPAEEIAHCLAGTIGAYGHDA